MAATRVVIALLVVAFVVASVSVLGAGAPFGWDESVYLVRARGWLGDGPTTGWGPHRPPGLPLLLTPLVAVATSEFVLRLVGVVAGVLAVTGGAALAAGLGGRAGGSFAAVIATAGLVTLPSLLLESTHVLTDVPSAALLVSAAALLWWQLERQDEPDVRIAWAGVALALAFTIRWGTVVWVGVTVIAVALVWQRTWRTHRGAALVFLGPIALAAAWHVVVALVQTGSPLGLVRLARRVAGTPAPGAAVASYADAWFGPLFGPVGGCLALVGVAAALVSMVSPTRRRVVWLLALPAVAQTAAVIASDEAEPRFLLPAVVVAVVAGATVVGAGATRLVARERTGWSVAVTLLVVVASVGFVGMGAARNAAAVAHDADLERFGPLRDAAVTAGEWDGTCLLVSPRVPQVTWYSGCATYGTVEAVPANLAPARTLSP